MQKGAELACWMLTKYLQIPTTKKIGRAFHPTVGLQEIIIRLKLDPAIVLPEWSEDLLQVGERGRTRCHESLVLGRIAFVTSLYHDLLLTSPGPADLFSWLQQLGAGSSALHVASAINQSPAHRA